MLCQFLLKDSQLGCSLGQGLVQAWHMAGALSLSDDCMMP